LRVLKAQKRDERACKYLKTLGAILATVNERGDESEGVTSGAEAPEPDWVECRGLSRNPLREFESRFFDTLTKDWTLLSLRAFR
jgi:hypothetical protein